jgi:hypothetical protein
MTKWYTFLLWIITVLFAGGVILCWYAIHKDITIYGVCGGLVCGSTFVSFVLTLLYWISE